MFGSWFKRRRRARLTTRATPDVWEGWLNQSIRFYKNWPTEMQAKLEACIKVIVDEKNWEGCEGLELTERMKVIISAHASTMLLGVDNYYFDGITTILVYPRSFYRWHSDGLVVDLLGLTGQAWQRGPIVLSWQDIAHPKTGSNLVIHELAHHLDGLDGSMDGEPILGSRQAQRRWSELSESEYRRLLTDSEYGWPTVLDPYGATNRAEFFAVASESFFEDAVNLAACHPELYGMLADYYHLDPREWVS